jgi:hypothetical protein
MTRRRTIERWFAARGVPQLIEGFSTEQRMDARALPFILVWLVAGTLLVWGRPRDADVAEQVLVGLVSVELLVTAGLLGGMCALYFTGLALTDAAYRADFHARVVGDVEQIMAVHAAYLASPEVPGS